MSIQTDMIISASAAAVLAWPSVSWSGTGIKRRAVQYGGVWYAEYACWDATTGISFNINADGVVADFFLISPGETGSAGLSTIGGTGGGAGVPQTALAIPLPQGVYTFAVTSGYTRVSGQAGSINAATPSGGVSSGTPYRLYGDATHEYGVAGSRNPPSSYTPGTGAAGCTFLPVRAQHTVYGISANSGAYLPGAQGVGAGGNGGGASNYLTGSVVMLANPGPGALGMILMRIPIVNASSISLPTHPPDQEE